MNSSWLIFVSIKALEIKTSVVFNLDFVSNTILPHFFLFFLIIDLCLLIPAIIAEDFNPIEELLILIWITTKEAKAEMEAQTVVVEVKLSKWSI